MFKFNINQLKPLQCYIIKIKNNCNLIVLFNNTNF